MKELEELFSLLEEGTSPYQVVSHTDGLFKKGRIFWTFLWRAMGSYSGRKILCKPPWLHDLCIYDAGAGRADGGYPHSGGAHRLPVSQDQTESRCKERFIRRGQCGSIRRSDLKYLAGPSAQRSRPCGGKERGDLKTGYPLCGS